MGWVGLAWVEDRGGWGVRAGGGAGGSGRASAARTRGLGGGAIDGGWFEGSASPSLRSGLWASWMRVVARPRVMRRSARPAPPSPPWVGTAHTHSLWGGWRRVGVLGRGDSGATRSVALVASGDSLCLGQFESGHSGRTALSGGRWTVRALIGATTARYFQTLPWRPLLLVREQALDFRT